VKLTVTMPAFINSTSVSYVK